MEPISKKDAKIDKIHRKRNSAQPQVLFNLIENSELSQNPSQQKITLHKQEIPNEEFLDPETQYIYQLTRTQKAKQWWQQLDQTYFKPLNRKNILLIRDLTSGERLKNFYNLDYQIDGLFQDEEIYDKFPLLADNTLMHVLFRSNSPFRMELVTYSFANYVQCPNRRPAKSIKGEESLEPVTMEDLKISSIINKLNYQHLFNHNSSDNIDQALKIGNLEWQAILQDDISICKFQKTMQTKNQMEFSEEIHVQLKLWENQLDQQSIQNSIMWNNLISKSEKNIQVQTQEFSQEVATMKSNLMHSTILRYIALGTKDKTQEMIIQLLENMKQVKPAKTREVTNKKFFETDCKICFCSFNSDSNQVLYCDMCNTSFHLACYGLREVPQDKEYFCDRCTAIKKDEKTKNNIRKITCQICCKPNFPIKEIGGHFYHMTLTVHEGGFSLREGLTHEGIVSRVIENELECNACIFCSGNQGGQLGMQLRCGFKGCESSMHPICGYINGCRFDVSKDMTRKRVEVKVFCNLHDCSRDYIQQTYLRRYMSRIPCRNCPKKIPSYNPRSSQLPKLIFDSKVIKKHISLREPRPVPKTDESENTEIRKILETLSKSKNKG